MKLRSVRLMYFDTLRFSEAVALITDLQGRDTALLRAVAFRTRAREMKRRKRLVRSKRIPLPFRGFYFTDLRNVATACYLHRMLTTEKISSIFTKQIILKLF